MVAQITPLSDPPSRSDPENFVERSDQFMSELPVFAIQANALAAEVNSKKLAVDVALASAENQVTLATEQKTLALNSANAAALSASNALASENAAADSEANAETSRIQASKLNLGNKSTPPTLDNQGATLLAGATYYDTTLNKWRVWNGTAWVEGISSVAGVSSFNGKSGPITFSPVSLQGDTAPYVTQTKVYTITNYNSFSTYSLTSSAGTANLVGDTINFTAPATAGSVILTLTVDGTASTFTLAVQPPEVATPTITSPAAGATGVVETPTITTSAFVSFGLTDTHLNSDWELWTGPNRTGTKVASSYADTVNKTSWVVPAGVMLVSTAYYVSVLHRGAALGASAWATSSFTTKASFNHYIPTPTATPANFGDALEGGFYAGMSWSQRAQSATSMALATGSKTFTVPDMTAAPFVYGGQTVEVRSRANPVNKFIGTVLSARGTQLTINVTSIGGSGTFSDWSIMSRHRVIVAPKSSGDNAGIALKNANTALPTACQTLTEGWAATVAMFTADTATVYPAAHWARNLNINGYSDWYIPARDELELCWRNLKPGTENNYLTRPTAQAFDYKKDGSYGDTAATNGTNNNSAPAGAAYTASVPGQTLALPFRTGGAEAFTYGSAYYWSSSDYDATSAWFQGWSSSIPGYQDSNGKTSTFRVRGVRRSII